MKLDIINLFGHNVGHFEISDMIFNIEIDKTLINNVLRYGSLAQRLGTAATRNRSRVAGSGKKRRRQKKTGTARMGERNPVHHRGGSVSFGPNGRQYDLKMNKRVRRLALKMVLADKFQNKNLVVLDEIKMNEPNTKNALKLKETFGFEKAVFVDSVEKFSHIKEYIFNGERNEFVNFALSVRNIVNIDFESVDTMNLHQLLWANKVFITSTALGELVSRFGGNDEENEQN